MSDILLDVKDLVIHYETDDGLVQALNGVSLQIHTSPASRGRISF